MDDTTLGKGGTPRLMKCYGPQPITRILEPVACQEAFRQKRQAAVTALCTAGHFASRDELGLLV